MRTIIIYKRIRFCYAVRKVVPSAKARPPNRSIDPLPDADMIPTIPPKRTLVFAAAALLASGALAQEAATYKLTARNGVFEPSTIEVPAGKRFRIEIVNEGKSAIEFESRDLRQEKVIPPGGKALVTISALKAGEYKFFDEFHEKTGQGKVIAK